MKPVNLLPGDAPAVVIDGGKPNLGKIGGVAAGLVAIAVVGGYFAMARVDSVKSETAAATQQAQEATQQTAAVRSQIASLGQPVVDSDKQLAQGYEQVLIGAYTERHNFVQLAQELRGIMPSGGWYVTVKAHPVTTGDAATSDTASIEIVGYMPTEQLAASFNERVNGTTTMKNADTVSLESEMLTDLGSKKNGTYWKFTVTAELVDTVAPSADDGGASTSDGTGTTVSNGGSDSDGLTLSLDPEHVTKVKVKVKKPAAPANPFDVAAAAAAGGGGS